MKKKGPFYYWTKNGTGPNARLEMLKTHYLNLAASYGQKGMKREAALFTEVAEKFERRAKELRELAQRESADES